MFPPVPNCFKILVIGDANVGRSSLILRFCDGIYTENSVPKIDLLKRVKNVEIGGQNVTLQICYSQNSADLLKSEFRDANGAIVVFDLTNPRDLPHTKNWKESLCTLSGKINLLLVGNKDDAERAISTIVAQEFAKIMGTTYIETSAKTGHNVDEVFLSLAKICLQKQTAQRQQQDAPAQSLRGGCSVS